MPIGRRSFLAALGVGAAAIVVPELVIEPRRRVWQVPRNAPVARRSPHGVSHPDAKYDHGRLTVYSNSGIYDFRTEERVSAGDMLVINPDGATVRRAATDGRAQTVIGFADQPSRDGIVSVRTLDVKPSKLDFMGEMFKLRDWNS